MPEQKLGSVFNQPTPTESAEPISADATEEVREFLTNIRRIPEILPMHEELSAALRQAMLQMQEHAGFVDLLSPSDIGLLVRGARELRGFVAADKQKRKRKSGSANAEKIAEMAQELGELLG